MRYLVLYVVPKQRIVAMRPRLSNVDSSVPSYALLLMPETIDEKGNRKRKIDPLSVPMHNCTS